MRHIKLCLSLMMFLVCGLFACAQAENVTVIRTADELAAMEWNGSYVLGNDIDLSGVKWEPIEYFAGTLDGAGHTISNLKIVSSKYHVGLFGNLVGSVSNLTIEDADITAIPGSPGCFATIIGVPDNNWAFDPNASDAHIFNCSVSGSIKVHCSTQDITNAAALCAAQDSTSDVEISVTAVTYNAAPLWGCRNCTHTGDMQITDLGGYGRVGMIMMSNDCSAEGDMTVTPYRPDNANIAAYGIGVFDGITCSNCTLTGDLYSPTNLTAISEGVNCTYDGSMTSDRLMGLMGCRYSKLSGTMTVADELSQSYVTPIQDKKDEESPSNIVESSYVHCETNKTTLISIFYEMGGASVNQGDITLFPNAGSADVAIGMNPTSSEHVPYNHGSIVGSTGSGDITIIHAIANDGEIDVSSTSGKITVVGGLYNTADITALSERGLVNATGATCYNSGVITATGNGVNAIGVSNTNMPEALNEGAVYAIGSDGCRTAIKAWGATGYANTYNTGEVSATGSYICHATGVNSPNGVNTGSVTAESTSNHAQATGAIGAGAFNTGNVTVTGTGSHIMAFGCSEDAAGSTGSVSATNNMSGYGICDAFGYAGPAKSVGHIANASGSTASARSTTTGQSCSGNTAKFACNCPSMHFATTSGMDDQPANERCPSNFDSDGNCTGPYSFYIYAWTQITGASSQNPNQITPPEIPEEEKPGNGDILNLSLLEPGSSSREIDSFLYTLGTMSYLDSSMKYNSSSCIVKLDYESGSDEAESFDLTLKLPNGFSFEPWSVKTEIPVTISVAPRGSYHQTFTVYPLYLDSCPASVTVRVSGDLKGSHSVQVIKNRYEGLVYARPTEKVNANDREAIKVRTSISPIRDFIDAPTDQYNANLALLTCALSQAVYDRDYLDESLVNLGFSEVKWYDSTSNHDIANCYALKKVVKDNQVYPIVLANIRGTVGTEWIGNFNVSNTSVHFDFAQCADNTYGRYLEYMSTKGIPRNSRTIFSAHSRAAAATNLVAHYLLTIPDNHSSEELTVYCYATPNSTKDPVAHRNIFNIIYIDDPVPYVPQGYYKHGVTFVVGDFNDLASDAVAAQYYRYAGIPYSNPRNKLLISTIVRLGEASNNVATAGQQLIGKLLSLKAMDSNIARAHGAENYLAWTQAQGIAPSIAYDNACSLYQELMDKMVNEIAAEFKTVWDGAMEELLSSPIPLYLLLQDSDEGSGIYRISCPVDVTVYNSEGVKVAELINHELKYGNEDTSLALTNGQSDWFAFPGNETFSFRITGNGEGTMRIDLAQFSGECKCVGSASYIDVPVAEGEVFELQLLAGVDHSDWIIVSDSGRVYFPETDAPVMYLPASTTMLNDQAFMGDASLSGVLVCPQGVTTLGSEVFSGTGLTGIFIPDSVQTIDPAALNGCSATIYCYDGSAIHRFASARGLNVVALKKLG